MTRFQQISLTTALVGIALGASIVGIVSASAPDAPIASPTAISETESPVAESPAPSIEPEPVIVPTPSVTPETQAATPTPTPTLTTVPAPFPEECTGRGMAGGPDYKTPLPCPPDAYTPPVLNCAPWMSPGQLNDHGDPTACQWNQPNGGGKLELPACESEDSINCFWDAQQRGNGVGRSFIDINGTNLYE